MYVLMYFPGDKKTAVIDEKVIRLPANGKKPNQGDIVDVKYGNVLHKGKIIRFGTKEYLGKLNVDKRTGELLLPTERGSKNRLQVNGVKKNELCKNNRNSEKAKQKTQSTFDRNLLKSMDKNAENKVKHSSEDVGGSEFDANGEKGQQSRPEHRNDDSEENRHPQVDIILNNSHKKDKMNCVLCDSCASLPVTPEVVIVVEHLLGHLKFQLSCRSGEKNGDAENEKLEMKHESWKIPGPGKVELTPCSGVWVHSGQLSTMTVNHRKDGKELARQILKWQVGEDKLKGMCAKGGSSVNAGLDPTLYRAVEDYIAEETGFNDKAKFTRLVNNMCGSLRSNKVNGLKRECKQLNSQEKNLSKKKKPKKSKLTISSSDDSSLGSKCASSNEFPGIKVRRTRKAAQRGTKIVSEEDEDSELELCSGWVDQMMGTKDFSSATERDQDDWEPPPGLQNSFAAQSGDFSIDLLNENLDTGKTKTSTPTKQPKRKRHSDDKYIFGRRSSASSRYISDVISPINPKKSKLHDNVNVPNPKTPENKSPTESASMTPRKRLSPKNLNVMSEVDTHVSSIPPPNTAVNFNGPNASATSTERVINNGDKENMTFNQGYQPLLQPHHNLLANFDYQPSWNHQHSFYPHGIPQQPQYYPYNNSMGNVHSTDNFQTEYYPQQMNAQNNGHNLTPYNSPFSYQNV